MGFFESALTPWEVSNMAQHIPKSRLCAGCRRRATRPDHSPRNGEGKFFHDRKCLRKYEQRSRKGR